MFNISNNFSSPFKMLSAVEKQMVTTQLATLHTIAHNITHVLIKSEQLHQLAQQLASHTPTTMEFRKQFNVHNISVVLYLEQHVH